MKLALSILLSLVASLPSRADEALVAVATNFASAAEALAAEYKAETGQEIRFSAGATGKLYAQIISGAPFDAFLAADVAAPAKLEAEGQGVAGTRFVYATGTLILWSSASDLDLSDPAASLKNAGHIAIANPDLAPYGKAAVETMASLGVTDLVSDRIVMAENIGQAYSLVATGAADIGFVAASSVLAGDTAGSAWTVPADLHQPILQAAILLRHGAENAAARGFLSYLASDGAGSTLARFGYGPGQ